MLRFILRRAAQLVPTLVGMSFVIFLMVRLLPGDIVDAVFRGEGHATEESKAAVRRALGLADPLPLQYLGWVRGILTGHLGDSLVTGRPVLETIKAALPITVELSVLAMIIATVTAIPLGVLSAVRPNTRRDFGSRIAGLVGLSVPDFWLATMILLFTSLVFRWVPPVIWISPLDHLLGNLGQTIIPAATLAVHLMATLMRMTRTTMLEVLSQDFIRTALAKGATERAVVYRHALRNALIPVVTVLGLQVGSLMSGATILEVIFGLPGIGYTLTSAIYNRDYPVIQDTAMFLAVVYLGISFGVDLLYSLLDPRIGQT